ncbi:hypothetical protein EZV62_008262 [Acer yangbiense]|uniref:Uncharacterized protein n=1 Tax=Acer yangbiense TaxID=1000413 RepID=A0A5C7ICN1_9ROSI|nr:hypothetical protein EZV62_008262 [Acer yangbiense]
MEIVKECGTSILSTIVEDLVKSTGRQVGYIFRFKSIIEELNEEAKNLKSTQDDMQHRVDRAIKDTDEIEKKVEKWLKDAEDLEKQTREKKTCLNGLCPNWIWKYQMARRAKKKISIMVKLRDGGKFDNVSHRTTLSGINVLTPKDFMLFESTTYTFNLIIEALKDDKTNVVGLYGMGEVGKTTLAKAVVNKAKEEKIFNEVVMVVVSQTPNIRGIQGNYDVEVSDVFFEEMKTLKVASLSWIDLSVKSLQFLTNLVTLQLIDCKLRDISSLKKLAKLEMLSLKGPGIVELPEELGELSKLRILDIMDHSDLKRIPVNVIQRLSRLEELYIKAWEVEGTSAEGSNASLSELSKLYRLSILCLFIKVHQRLPQDFVLPTKLLRHDIRVNYCSYELPYDSYPKSRLLTIRGIEATSLVAFKALYENVEYLELVGIKGCCQNMVPSIDETGLNELKMLSIWSFDELECIIDTRQQQDVAFSNLVDLSLSRVDLREICSGGRPPRGFLENLETLGIRRCHSMSSLFPSWVLIQRLRKLKEVTVGWCGELEDVFQLEGLSYAKENPFLLSSLESLHLFVLQNLRYIWKGPTQQLEELIVYECGSLEHIVEIKEAEENDVIFPKLRILKLGGLENFISFFDSENYSSTWPALQELILYLPLNSTTSFVAQLEANSAADFKRVLAQLIHGFQNLEELKIRECRLSQLELSLPSLKVLELGWLEELECLCKGPTHLLSLPNLKKLSVRYCNRLRHMFSPSLATNLLQLEELFISYCGELEQIFIEDDAAEYNQTLLKDHLQSPLLFPNLSSIDISNCGKLKSVFPVSIAHLLSLQNLTTLELSNCDGLTHLFSSTLARNLLQLESIDIMDCGELEQIIIEDHTEDHHVQVGLFPNLSSISVYKCGKLKTLFPTVTIARSGLQKLKTIYIGRSFQLEELFGHKDEADMTSHRETVLPQLQKLTLKELASLINFCPVGYHFIFPSLSKLFVTKCPKLTTRFSVDQNRSVHAEAKAPQTGKENADMEQSPPETTREIYCQEWMPNALREQLPPYIGK